MARPTSCDIQHEQHAGESLVLKILIQAMMDLLDTSEVRSVIESLSLDTDATALTVLYNANGLSGSLSTQAISDGITDCEEALDLLTDPNVMLDISSGAATDLQLTIESLEEDLQNAN